MREESFLKGIKVHTTSVERISLEEIILDIFFRVRNPFAHMGVKKLLLCYLPYPCEI